MTFRKYSTRKPPTVHAAWARARAIYSLKEFNILKASKNRGTTYCRSSVLRLQSVGTRGCLKAKYSLRVTWCADSVVGVCLVHPRYTHIRCGGLPRCHIDSSHLLSVLQWKLASAQQDLDREHEETHIAVAARPSYHCQNIHQKIIMEFLWIGFVTEIMRIIFQIFYVGSPVDSILFLFRVSVIFLLLFERVRKLHWIYVCTIEIVPFYLGHTLDVFLKSSFSTETIFPLVFSSNPAKIFSSVLFPLPLGPATAVILEVKL